jgi:multiple sugar transport system permease protein
MSRRVRESPIRKMRESPLKKVRDVPLYVLALGYVVFVLAPIVYMFLVSVQPTATAGTEVVPRVWHWQTFQEIWKTVDLVTYLRNSIVISVATGVCSTILALGAGYVVARFRFRFRNLFRISLLASHSVPGILLLLPLYVIYVIIQHVIGIALVGTYWGVILTYMTFGLPFAIWMLSVYIVELPIDLEEQAMVDGANRLSVLRWVTVPLAIPGMVVSFVFTFLLAWNDVLFAGALTSPSTRTLGVALQTFLSQTYSLPQWNQLMGASIVSAVPAVILFLLVQRHMVTGLSAGSVKG